MKEQIKGLIESKKLNIADYADSWELNEALDYDGSLHELIDSQIDIYNYDLRVWAVHNYHFIDEAIDEGLASSCDDFHKLIQVGQYVQNRHDVYETLEELVQHSRNKAV